MALQKTFKLTERVNINFKFEMFNIMNHANFGLPNTTAITSATGAGTSTAGLITNTVTNSRQLQFALRLNF